MAQCRYIYVYRNRDANHKGIRIPVRGKTMAQILKVATKALSNHQYFAARKFFCRMVHIKTAARFEESMHYVVTSNLDDFPDIGRMPFYMDNFHRLDEPEPISLATPTPEMMYAELL